MKTGGEPDKDVHISLEDQQKINKFARSNQKMEELNDELKAKKNEIVTLGDATADVEEFGLMAADDDKIPFQIGEIFVMESPDTVQELIEKKRAEAEEEVLNIQAKMDAVKGVMSDLKTHLYAKFGDAINLEADD